jgi:uncharacterized SAM-binding protein YcdF (DUF218 family)
VRRFLLLVAGALGGAILLWLASAAAVLWAGYRPDARPADVILVAGAAQYNGRPSPVLQARVDHAIRLWRDHLAPRRLFTGGVGAGDTVSEGEVARRYAIAQGVPDSSIMVERAGHTSAESIAAAASLMRNAGLRTAVLVSDTYHMLRLELLARRAGIRAYRSPAPASPIDRDRATHRRYVLRESLLLPAEAVRGGE